MSETKRYTKGYSEAGASIRRRALRGFNPVSGSPREDIDYNNRTLRQRSRTLYMAEPLAAAAIDTNRTKVIGTGLELQAAVNREALGLTAEAAKAWQKNTEEEFRLWAEDKDGCDALGLNTFAELQQLALKSQMVSGDAFVLIKRYAADAMHPYTLRLQLIEADRVSTPPEFGASITATGFCEGKVPDGKPGAGNMVYDGVEVDSNGRAAAYYICSAYPYQTYTSEIPTWTRIEARDKRTGLANILHLMSAERPDQYRGVPYLAGVIEQVLQLRRYTESELTSALIQSFFTAWIHTDTDPTAIPFNETGAGDIAGAAANGYENNLSDSPSEYEMGPGAVLHLADGESVTFGEPKTPNASYEAFVKSVTKSIGAGLEIPYDVLVKEFNSSYSASRGALLEAWEAFKMRRAWFVADFCKPIYELWLSEAAALGRVTAQGFFINPRARAAWCGANWIGPVQGQLDPKKEAEAAIMLAQCGIKSYEQITRELGGGDWDDNAERLKAENEKLAEAGAAQTLTFEGDKYYISEGGSGE